MSEGMVEVLASHGDVFLGGADIDNAIVDWLADEFKKDHAGVDLRKDSMALARLVEAAEKAKCELSTSTSTEINLPYITVQDGVPQMLVTTLTRAKFDALIDNIVKKVINCGKDALKKAGLKASDIDEILLVGGSCRIPALQDALTKAFNRPLNKGANLDEAVALGAAIQANTLAGNVEDAVLLLDVTPISLGIETMNDVFAKLVEANTTIPVSKKQTFSTAADNQTAVDIVVLQGERPFCKDNKVIGRFRLDGIAPAPRGIPQIEVTFDIDANGILSVSAKDLGTGKEQNIKIENSSLSDEEIERIKADAEKFAEEDKKRTEEVAKRNQMVQLAFAVKKSLDEESIKSQMSEDELNNIKDLVAKVEEKEQAPIEELESASNALQEAWKPIAEKIYAQQAPQQSTDGEPMPENPFGAN